jgi:hypothetical protein
MATLDTKGQAVLAPDIGTKRCNNCKFQGVLPEFGDNMLCLEGPPVTHVVPHIFMAIGPGDGLRDENTGNVLPFPKGGLQVVAFKNEARFPPAPNHWSCGHWSPRFLHTDGSRLK